MTTCTKSSASRILNSSLQALHYHITDPNLIPEATFSTGKQDEEIRALETSLVEFKSLKANLHAAICRPDLSASINREANRFKVNLHAAICRPDLSATINREANRFIYSASTAHAFFYS